jgi:ATP synthase protein I
MSQTDALRRDARRVLWTQVLLAAILALGFLAWRGAPAAAAALYGGMVTLLVTGWLAWRLRRVTARAPQASLGVIYSSALLRYVAVAGLIGVGLGVLRLAPLPLLSAFAVTQFGFLASLRRGRN